MSTIKILRSHNAVIVVLVVALLAQMPHAQDVFYSQGHAHTWFGWVASIFAAVALEIAVLVFVVRGNIYASWGFALFSIAINLVYYADAQSAWWMPNPSWLLSAGLPIAIALYSHEVADQSEESPVTVQPDMQPHYAIVLRQLDDMLFEVRSLQEEMESVQSKITTVQEPEFAVQIEVDYAQIETDTVQPEIDDAQTDCAEEETTVQDETPIVHEPVDLKQRSAQLKSEGFSNAQISEMLGVHRNTISAWNRQPLHTNGYHKEA